MLFMSASLLALLYEPIAVEQILHVFTAVFAAIGLTLLVKGRLSEDVLVRYTDSYVVTFEVRLSDFGWAFGKMARFSRGIVIVGLVLDAVSLPVAASNLILGIAVFIIGTVLALWGEQWLTTTEPYAGVDWSQFPKRKDQIGSEL